MSFLSLFGSHDQIMALYEGLSDEQKAEFYHLIDGLDDGGDDAELLVKLIQGSGSDWREHKVDAGFGKKPYAQNNTWPHVREIRSEIVEDYGTYLSVLNASWTKLSADYGDFLNRDRDEAFGSTPLEALLMVIREGYYPPPEILIAVADCFEAYFARSEKVSMDLFFKELGHKVGDFSAQRSKERPLIEFEMMRRLNKLRPKGSKKDAEDLLMDFLITKSGAPKPSKKLRDAMARAILQQPKNEQPAWKEELERDFNRKLDAHGEAYDKANSELSRRIEQQKTHRKNYKPKD